jgi:hypothetical protein
MVTVVDAARDALGPVGVCLPGSLTVPLIGRTDVAARP